jgi:hypothetical protein
LLAERAVDVQLVDEPARDQHLAEDGVLHLLVLQAEVEDAPV